MTQGEFCVIKISAMSKTIVIPTDFQVESLNTLRFALAEQNEPVTVVLLYGHFLTDSITQLLFYSKERITKNLMNSAFQEALQIITNRYEKHILDLKIEPLNYPGPALLRNLLQSFEADMVYVPAQYRLRENTRLFDVCSLLRGTKLPVKEFSWESHQHNSDDQLAPIFFSQGTIAG